MALLDPRPKEKEADMFGRTTEIVKLNRYIDDREPLIVVSGLRRIGKTSLIKTVLSKRDYSIFVDGWKLGEKTGVTKSQILELFETAIQQFFNKNMTKKEQFLKFIRSVAGISFNGYGIQFHPEHINESNLTSLFDGLNNWAIENDQIIVIAVDEVQEFSKARDIDLRKIFSSFYNYDNIVLILTGSQIGSLHDFIKKDDADGPFYGKDRICIRLNSLNESESKEFLIKGLAQKGIAIKRTIPYNPILDKAANELGGVIGWLVNFGRRCVRDGKISENAILETQEEGSKQMQKEFEKFLIKKGERTKYLEIMRNLVKLTQYNFIKYIKSYNLQSYLDDLEDEGFIKKDDKKRYFFSVRLLEYHFRKEIKLVPLQIKKKKPKKSKKK